MSSISVAPNGETGLASVLRLVLDTELEMIFPIKNPTDGELKSNGLLDANDFRNLEESRLVVRGIAGGRSLSEAGRDNIISLRVLEVAC